MSPSVLTWLLASFSTFLAFRMFDGALQFVLLGIGAALGAATLAMRARTIGSHPDATRLSVGLYALAGTSLFFYMGSVRDTTEWMQLSGDAAREWRVALQALSALVWFVGTLPAITIDRTLHASPRSVHPLRLRTALEGGFALAFGLAMLLPLNWLASEFNERYDYSFFKTTTVSASTRQIVEGLDAPMRAVLFFPAASEVRREIQPYFDTLEGANLSVEVMDFAMEPELAKQWKVREDGVIALVKGEAVETVKLGDDLQKARSDLRKLDTKVQTALLKLAREKRTAYFTVGHDELHWKNPPSDLENVSALKTGIEGLNYKVKELGLDEGLAQEIPDDAAVVFITGPKRPFMPEEVDALRAYRDRGGKVFLMLEPTETPDPALAALFGVAYTPSRVVSDKRFVPMTRGISDRQNVGTDTFGSHESVTSLSKAGGQAALILPGLAAVSEAEGHPGKVTVTVKGSSEWWVDLDGNFEFDSAMEKRGGLDAGVVASGPASEGEWRAAIIGDATWVANPLLSQAPGNRAYLIETLGWLTEDPALTGAPETEEDVRIQHTREGEAMWFYGTSAVVPALVFVVGLLRVASRRRKGAA